MARAFADKISRKTGEFAVVAAGMYIGNASPEEIRKREEISEEALELLLEKLEELFRIYKREKGERR